MPALHPAQERPPIERVLVLLPTYNERENLERILERIHAATPQADILVLDDNSPDGTGDLADEIAASSSHVQVMHREGKQGLGQAYLAGFEWGLARGYDALVEIDADGSHPAEALPAMLALAEGADLVIGSRWIKGGSVVNWPKHREALSRAANLYVRGLLGTHVHDATAGYRVYRAATLRAIELCDVTTSGYGFQVEVTLRVLAAGGAVVEHPIRFAEREFGVSKMSSDIIAEAFTLVTKNGLRHRGRQAKALFGR